MKIGVRKPSLKKRIAARLSWKRFLRHNLGLKMPRGWGWITNPKKYLYNKIYYRTTVSADDIAKKTLGLATGKKRSSKSKTTSLAKQALNSVDRLLK